MHKKFVKYLIDPKTGEDLVIESSVAVGDTITSGFLVSKSNRYPIVRGVPRFSGYMDNNNYTKSFGWQWNKWAKIQFDSYNVGKPMQGYTKLMWDKITHISTTDLNGGAIVDIGCGPGRFLETILEKNGLAIGIDMSDAVEAAIDNFPNNPNVLICQADILHSPIRTESVDGIFSIGVLHHTSNPKKGFDEMVRAVKPDGWISVSVYSTGGYYDNFIVNIYRKIFKRMWPIFGHYPPLIYSYLVVYVSRVLLSIPIFRTLIRPFLSFFPFINIKKDIGWSVLNTFDSITPSNQSGHTLYEVFNWFKKEKLREIEPSNWAGASVHAIK
jgi:SAM-dependent methyltransferase